MTPQRIFQLFKKFNLKYIAAKTQLRKIHMSANIKFQSEKFVQNAKQTLFDISACKCSFSSELTCSCSLKLSVSIQRFLFNQRNERTLRISEFLSN